MPEELTPGQRVMIRRRRRLRDILRATLFVAIVFTFCWFADRYRLSPRADLTPVEALGMSGVRWAYVTESDGVTYLAVPREPFDPLHWLGFGTLAVYVFEVPSNRLVDWTVDHFRDEAFERRQLFNAGRYRRVEKEEARRLLDGGIRPATGSFTR